MARRPAGSGRCSRLALAGTPALVVGALLLVLPAAGCAGEPATSASGAQAAEVTVDFVVDGDTIELADGRRVRLVQIDAPEAGDECYGKEADRALYELVPNGTTIRLERDPALDDVDRYDRLLRYVHRDGTNVNLALVREGAASVWFVDGDRGRYADELLQAARTARAQGRGAWSACEAELDPYHGFETTAPAGSSSAYAPAPGPGSASTVAPPETATRAWYPIQLAIVWRGEQKRHREG